MYYKTLLAAAALFANVIAVPALSSRTTGWSITNFKRNCTDPSICTYFLNVETSVNNQTCTIVDTASPATNHSFYGTPCQEYPAYHISWGWEQTGIFTVMTVVNETSQTEAFFGYDYPNSGLPVVSYASNGPNAVQPV